MSTSSDHTAFLGARRRDRIDVPTRGRWTAQSRAPRGRVAAASSGVPLPFTNRSTVKTTSRQGGAESVLSRRLEITTELGGALAALFDAGGVNADVAKSLEFGEFVQFVHRSGVFRAMASDDPPRASAIPIQHG